MYMNVFVNLLFKICSEYPDSSRHHSCLFHIVGLLRLRAFPVSVSAVRTCAPEFYWMKFVAMLEYVTTHSYIYK